MFINNVYICTPYNLKLYNCIKLVFKMEKLQINQILVKDAKLSAVKLNETNTTVTNLINETKQKQVEVLKLKEVDQERLRMIVQL